ncbi:MAG: hypothetical protein J1G38_02050 [Clostridiales bacterium]|nr:hypothetical protein [Clostridiales bacterium]
MSKKKNYKLPKNHFILHLDGVYFGRNFPSSEGAHRNTVTAKKTNNILALFEKMRYWGEEPDADIFCESAEISMSNYRRLLAVVNKYLSVDDGSGNTVELGRSTARYLTILALFDELTENGADRKEFCAKHNISRTTFFRYLSAIENYLINGIGSHYVLVAVDEDGRYHAVNPDD